jgi:hypothetical protein
MNNPVYAQLGKTPSFCVCLLLFWIKLRVTQCLLRVAGSTDRCNTVRTAARSQQYFDDGLVITQFLQLQVAHIPSTAPHAVFA